ncbi:MAG: RING finger domain-containing protein [Candidatus Babeliales bacterium]|nr:RING finger domain-containing protein [Candidatus Babeliales bacterium]
MLKKRFFAIFLTFLFLSQITLQSSAVESDLIQRSLNGIKNNKGTCLIGTAVAGYYLYKNYNEQTTIILKKLASNRGEIFSFLENLYFSKLINNKFKEFLINRQINPNSLILNLQYYSTLLMLVAFSKVIRSITKFIITDTLFKLIRENNEKKNLSSIKLLIYLGANINANESQFTRRNDVEKLWQGIFSNTRFFTPLTLAIDKKQIDTVKFLTSWFECDLDQKDKSNTPLYYAVTDNNLPITGILLDNGAKDAGTIDIEKLSPEMEHLLIQRRALLQTFLKFYCKARNYLKVRECITNGANPNEIQEDGLSLIRSIALKKHYEIIRELSKANGPTKFFRPDQQQESCSICMCTGELYPTKCKHYFHSKCLVDWLEHNAGCPLCRATI